MKIRYLRLPLLAIACSLVSVQSYGATLLELEFPYSTKWSGTKIQHFGSKVIDFDNDGQVDDHVKLAAFSTPQSAEYIGTDSGTNAGPELVMRAAIANLDAPDSTAMVQIGVPGVTPEGIRIEPNRQVPGLSSNAGFVAWWYIPSESFANGGYPASFAQGGSIEAESIVNHQRLVWRLIVKHDGKHYVSDAGSDRTRLRIPDLNSSKWVLYSNAESGFDMRLKVDPNSVLSGNELTKVEGVGVYAELFGFDAPAADADKRTVIDIKKLTVKLP